MKKITLLCGDFDNTKGKGARVVLTMYILPLPDPKTSTECCWTDRKGKGPSPALPARMEIDRSDRRAANGNTYQFERARIKTGNGADR